MAVDYGRKRVGIAITDPLCVISQPFLTLNVSSDKELIIRLKCLIKENQVGCILIGNPLSHKGEATEISKDIQRFLKRLKKSVDIEVILWDERFTSKYALNLLKSHGFKYKRQKVDEIAACIMLDEYLKSQPICPV